MQPRDTELIDFPVTRYDAQQGQIVEDHKYTSIERYLDIYLNGERLTTSFCSPGDLEDLVTGVLAQMGKIRTSSDITSLSIDEKAFTAHVETTADAQQWAAHAAEDPRYYSAREILDCAPERIFARPRTVQFVAQDILARADKLLSELAATHEKTNGVHSGILYDQRQQRILVFREDIGRHNVFDKLYGWSLRKGIDLADKIIIFSGRCSSEMMLKLGRMGIGAVAAKSVPTTLSLRLAKKLGITLVARMRPGSFCIYTNPERIIVADDARVEKEA